MQRKLKHLNLGGKNTLIILMVMGFIIAGIYLTFEAKVRKINENLINSNFEVLENRLTTIQGNSLLPSLNPSNPEPQVVKKMNVIVTAYSSSTFETDDDPYITAAGTLVREGIVANNGYSFGTKIKFPEIFGDRVFVVEDRMSWKKGNYHVDIWFPSYKEAKSFGARWTYAEILE